MCICGGQRNLDRIGFLFQVVGPMSSALVVNILPVEPLDSLVLEFCKVPSLFLVCIQD